MAIKTYITTNGRNLLAKALAQGFLKHLLYLQVQIKTFL